MSRRLIRFLARSDHPVARMVRLCRRSVHQFEVPAPRVVVRPLLAIFLGLRAFWYFFKQKFVCEPILKAYCTSHGRHLQAGVFVPWVEGVGDLQIGDDVSVFGKVSITFAMSYSARPTLTIGNKCVIGHECRFTVGKSITIGDHCMLASGVMIADSNGHPLDPEQRRAGLPAPIDKVRPVVIEDNVWLANGCVILPGARIGEGSVVGANAVVRGPVPPYSLVVGNPAQVVGSLARPDPGAEPSGPTGQAGSSDGPDQP
jgi:acetyltransferase-like isoleucine patch superfamily enzyme